MYAASAQGLACLNVVQVQSVRGGWRALQVLATAKSASPWFGFSAVRDGEKTSVGTARTAQPHASASRPVMQWPGTNFREPRAVRPDLSCEQQGDEAAAQRQDG